MADYRFVTGWHLDAPIEKVWDLLDRPADYPAWWPYVARSELVTPRGADGLGDVWAVHWKTALLYDLIITTRATRREPPHRSELESTGELVGTGRWTLATVDDGTDLQYAWHVRTTPIWMNLLAPFTHFFFTWNHHQVMRSGAIGMAQRLGVPMRGLTHRADVQIAGQPAAAVSAAMIAALLAGGVAARAARR